MRWMYSIIQGQSQPNGDCYLKHGLDRPVCDSAAEGGKRLIENGQATTDEMVLAFVRAEARSPNWGNHYERSAWNRGMNLAQLIDGLDFSPAANQSRRGLLADVRGFQGGQGLLRDFPHDVVWRRAEIEPLDHNRLLYVNDRNWSKISRGTRRVRDANRGANHDLNSAVVSIIDAICGGQTFPELILVEDGNDLVIVEGNDRATAYVANNSVG
jgi:hypothetical protein